MAKIELTSDEIIKCKRAVNRTYCTIADNAGWKDSTPLTDILEVVLDANYVKSYGGLDIELYKKFDAWVMQEIAAGKFKTQLKKIAKVIWYR